MAKVRTIDIGTKSPAFPKDPLALVQVASQMNGLHSSDLKPWHVRASFQGSRGGRAEQGRRNV